MVENQHWSRNCGQKEIVPGGQKENEARKASRKASRKAMKAFGKVDFRISPLERRRARIETEKAREVPIHSQGFSASE